MQRPEPWTHAETRAWVDRHGGNVTAMARRLRVGRKRLQEWLADPETASGARPLPPYVQGFMTALDEIAALEAVGGRVSPQAQEPPERAG